VNVNRDSLRQVARFGASYRRSVLAEEQTKLGLREWEALRGDWWRALRFFFNRTFYRGRSDYLSTNYKHSTCKALMELLGEGSSGARAQRLRELSDAHWLDRSKWRSGSNPVRVALKKRYSVEAGEEEEDKFSATGNRYDHQMVLDTLRFITQRDEKKVLNLARYSARRIQEGSIRDLYEELYGIDYIGHKLTSFYLRDLVCVLGLKRFLRPEDYVLLQPVDTWVEKLARRLHIKGGRRDLQLALTQCCQDAKVDPIYFSQGAWYLARHSLEIFLRNLGRVKP